MAPKLLLTPLSTVVPVPPQRELLHGGVQLGADRQQLIREVADDQFAVALVQLAGATPRCR